jgi:hypothetical protein
LICDEFIAALSASARLPAQLAAHAEHCPHCADLWQADAQLRGTGARAPAHGAAPGVQLQRLFDAHRGSTRAAHPARRIAAVLGAAAACIGVAFWCVPRADLRVAAAALLVLPFAAFALLWIAALQLYAYRGRSGLGVPPWLRWAFVAASVVLFESLSALEAAKLSTWNASLAGTRIAASNDCLLLGLGVAGLVGAVAVAVTRHTVLIGAASAGALAGSIAGLTAVMFLHLHCAAADAGHLAIVHALPLVCAIVAGAFTGRRILAA